LLNNVNSRNVESEKKWAGVVCMNTLHSVVDWCLSIVT
jgi:hypothetical protein